MHYYCPQRLPMTLTLRFVPPPPLIRHGLFPLASPQNTKVRMLAMSSLEDGTLGYKGKGLQICKSRDLRVT